MHTAFQVIPYKSGSSRLRPALVKAFLPNTTLSRASEPLASDKQFPTLEEIGVDLVYHIESGGPDLRDLRGV